MPPCWAPPTRAWSTWAPMIPTSPPCMPSGHGRERSIEVRARDIEVPNLKDEALIRTGAGNYNAMCVGCHLAPGVDQTELSQALYPRLRTWPRSGPVIIPPWRSGPSSMASRPQACRHGARAWGSVHLGIVAFLDRLPQMDAQQYQAMVASSGGHQHSGGECDAQRWRPPRSGYGAIEGASSTLRLSTQLRSPRWAWRGRNGRCPARHTFANDACPPRWKRAHPRKLKGHWREGSLCPYPFCAGLKF